jgi:site-specific DNA recombinase
LSVIEDTKKKLEKIKKEEERQKKKEKDEKEKSVIAKKVSGLSEVWDKLEMRERRAIIRSVVERIVINGDKINIYYHF